MDGSLEALRPRLSTGLPLSAGVLGRKQDGVQLCRWLPAFGGPTSLTLADPKSFSFVTLRLRLSTGFALCKGIAVFLVLVHA